MFSCLVVSEGPRLSQEGSKVVSIDHRVGEGLCFTVCLCLFVCLCVQRTGNPDAELTLEELAAAIVKVNTQAKDAIECECSWVCGGVEVTSVWHGDDVGGAVDVAWKCQGCVVGVMCVCSMQ